MRVMKIPAAILACMSLMVALSAEAAIHVAPAGADTNAGTEAAPLASVTKAVAVVNETGGPGEIVIHEGRYAEAITVRQPKLSEGAKAPPLLIRAAEGARVVFDGSVLVTNAEPFAGKSNVYLVKGAFPGGLPPDVWEEDTRIRYTKAADVKSVARFPNSIVVLNKEIMALSTSDGAPPWKHVVRYSIPARNTGCVIGRDNTTVRGISFENWSSVAIDLRGSNGLAEDCSAYNCKLVFNAGGRDNRCIRCIGREVGSGAYSGGTSNVIEHCRFFAARGAFGFDLYSQNDTGIQYYSPANGGTVRFNLCEGFQNGIFCKAVTGTFLAEHNTCIGLKGQDGFYLSNWKPGSIVRQNIFDGFINTILNPDYLASGGVFDENLFWNPTEYRNMWKEISELRKYGTGWFNRIGDSRFADPGKGDYRLLRGMTMGDAEGAVGAMPYVPETYTNSSPPVVKVIPDAPVQYNGATGKLVFMMDPWNGAETNLLESLEAKPFRPSYITKDKKVRLNIKWEPAGVVVTRMKLSLDGRVGEDVPFKAVHDLELPEKDGVYAIDVKVGTKAGVWGEPFRLEITLGSKAPALAGPPRARTNRHGAVLFIVADRPVLCAVEVQRKENGQWIEINNSIRTQCKWDAGLGGALYESWQVPAMTQTIALTEGAADWIRPGKENRYRLKLRDMAGNESVTEHTLKFEGQPKMFYVATDGMDSEGRGNEDQPFATLQNALDQTLPGDTVRLLPGVHLGAALFHGGARDAPITIEAEKPGTVILDSMKKIPSLLYLEKAPWVVIRNLELRWFQDTGITVYQSSNVTVSHCRVWNGLFSSWIEGRGIFFYESPNGAVDHCTAFHLENGITLLSSPGARITFNTSSCNMYGGLGIDFSSKDTVARNNVFCFNGISAVGVYEGPEKGNPEVVASLDLDYNNYAARIRASEMGDMTPEKNLVSKHKSCQESKYIIGCAHVENLAKLPDRYPKPFFGLFYTLDSWQKSSGKDAHTICADPLFVNPAHFRFDVEKESPNIGAGENGSTIGAEGWLGTETENEFRGEYFIIKFKNNAPVQSFTIYNCAVSYSKDFRVYLSEDGREFRKAAAGTLKNANEAQSFKITPQKAQYIKLLISSGYGEYYWKLAEFEAYSRAGVNVACETNGAELIKFTSEENRDYWSAKNINDGKTNTYWASARDPEPVE